MSSWFDFHPNNLIKGSITRCLKNIDHNKNCTNINLKYGIYYLFQWWLNQKQIQLHIFCD